MICPRCNSEMTKGSESHYDCDNCGKVIIVPISKRGVTDG